MSKGKELGVILRDFMFVMRLECGGEDRLKVCVEIIYGNDPNDKQFRR